MPLDFSVLGQEPINPASGLDFSILNTPSRVGTQTTNINPSEYADYIGEVRPEFGQNELNVQRAVNQSSGEQFGAFLNQAIVGEIIGGTIEGIGFLGDIDDAVKIQSGEELNLGNAVVDFGQSLRAWSKEATPIYETDPGKFAPGNFSWWATNGTSVASTLSLMLPAAGTVKGLSMLGKAVGIGANLSKIAGLATTGISQAVVSRHIENLLEASGKYDEIYQRNLSNGLSEEEAKQNAGVAASDIYQKNWVMLAQDIPQYMLLGKSFGKASKAITRGVAKELGETGYKEGAKAAGRYFTDALSEGGEEAYQYIVSEKADDLAMSRLDPDYRPRQLKEFLKEDEFWTSATMGMLGAGAFQMAGRAVNKLVGVESEEKQRINNIRKFGPTIKYYSEMIKDAEDRNDLEAYEEARQGMVNTLAGKASELGDLDILVNKLELILGQEANQEAVEKFGLDEQDIATINKDFPNFIEDVKEVGKAYEHYAETYDQDIASQLAQLETSKVRLTKRKKDLSKKLENDLAKLEGLGLNDLSPAGKVIARINSDLKAHDKVLKYIKSNLKKKDLDETSRAYYTDALKKREDILLTLRNKRQEIRKSDSYSKNEREADAKINLDSSILAEADATNTKLQYADQAIDKKNEAIKFAKDVQAKRKKGEKVAPVEPELIVEDEVTSEQPVDETTHAATSKNEETTNVETELYEADPKQVVERRKKANDRKILEANTQNYGAWTLNELFSEFESIEVVKDKMGNTGILKKEGGNIYFYEDTTNKKYDMSQYVDISSMDAKIFLIGAPKLITSNDPIKDKVENAERELYNNELDAIQPQEPIVEHPSSDEEAIVKNVKDDTITKVGEINLAYPHNKEKELTKWLDNPVNDVSSAIGTFSIDLGNVTIKDDKRLLKALKLNKLTQEQFDKVPIALKLDVAPGTLFVPTPNNVNLKTQAERDNIRTIRTTIIEALQEKQIVTIKGFRKDSGHSYITPKKGVQNNIIKSLNIPLSEITLGIALRTGRVIDKNDNTLQIQGNPNGGNVYLYTDRTPNKEFRGIKLNKAKVSEEHAHIILNAFKQGVKSFKNKYIGDDVKGDISIGALINILVQNGEDTIITDTKRKVIADKSFLERLERNQLYSSKGYLHYGKSGKINLKNLKEEDINNFVQYATENFNYSISLGRLKDNVPNIKIGTMQLEEGMTFEHMYVSNGLVTTDAGTNEFGNVIETSQIYVDFSNLSKIEVEKIEPSTPIIPPKSDTPLLNEALSSMIPFSSTYYEGKQYVRQSSEKQIEEIYSIISRDIPIEVSEDLIRVVTETGSHLAFGQVKDAGIKLYEKAEDGTGYHEAYHIISLYYLTGRERKKVYDDAAKYYNINRADERSIEEALAEDFRNYMISDKSIAPKQKSTRNLFQRLYDFIMDLFVKPETRISNLTIDKLFNNIENGKYTEAKVLNKNAKKYAGYDYLRKIEGFSTDQIHSISNLLMYQMLTKNNIIKLEDLSRLSLDPAIDYIKDLVKTVDNIYNVSNSDVEKQEAKRLSEVYTKILTNIDKFTELISDRLFAMNINRKADVFEDTNGINVHNIFVNDSGGSDLTKYDRASYQSSGKDNLLANIKLFIATLPSSGEIDPYTKFPKMTDFSEAYSKIMKDLNESTNFEEIIKALEQKAEKDIFYKVLLDGHTASNRVGLRNAPDSFKHQFEIATYMHRHDFVNVSVDKKGNHIFVDAAVSKAERDLASEWGINFYQKGIYINSDDTTNSDKLDSVREDFVKNIQTPMNAEYARGFKVTNYDLYIDKIKDILNTIGIVVSREDLDNVIEQLGTDTKGNQNNHYGLEQLINNTLFGLFGAKGVLLELSTNKLTKYQKPEELLAKDSKVIEFARMIIANNIYIIDDTVLGAENNTYYVYAQPSLLTEYVKDLKQGTELFEGLRNVKYNTNSQYLKQIGDGSKFGLTTFASYRRPGKAGEDYKKIDDSKDFLLKLTSLYNGLIPMPTLADRQAYYFYKGLTKPSFEEAYIDKGSFYIPDSIIDILYGYAKDEQSRIAKVRAEIKEAKETKNYSKLFLNMHYTRTDTEGKPLFSLNKYKEDGTINKDFPQGLQYRHFTEFNDKEINKGTIRKALQSNIKDTINYAESLKLLKVNRDKNDNIVSIEATKDNKGNQIDTDLLTNYTKKYRSKTYAIYHIMAEFTINTSMSVIETEKLLTGDPAYYKNVEDKIKRLNAPVAPGSKIIEEFTSGDLKGVTEYKTAIIKSFKFNDVKLIAQLAPRFAEAYRLQNPDATDKEISEAVNLRLTPYTETDVTDAQTYVTPAMYRSLKKRMGEWEDSHESAYSSLIYGMGTEEGQLKAEQLIMQPLKLVHFGQYFKNEAGIPIYDKMSVAVLLPSIVKGTLLEPLYNKMITGNIDMVKYDSAVKVGNTGAVTYFDKETGDVIENTLDNLRTFQQRFKYLRKQQVTDPHVTEARLLGTQVKKVVMQNLRLDKAIYKIKGSNNKYTGREIANMFSKAYSTLSNRGREAVEKELGIDANNNVNKTKLYDALRKAGEQSNQPFNVVDNLYVDEKGNPKVQLDTLLNRGWTESRMISFITKNTIDTTISGTDLIQMSGGGLITSNSEQLQLLDSKGRTEITVAVSLFKSIIPNYDEKNHVEKVKWLRKNWSAGFDGIGYRIPTQGQNSVIPFVIKEFLPESYGNTIILPYGFPALTGSDFDIDKLFIAKYNYYTLGDNVYKYKFYEGNEEGAIEDEKILKEIWKAYTLPKIIFRDNLIELKQKIDRSANKEAALLNAWNNDLDLGVKVNIAEELNIDSITQDVLDLVGLKMTYNQLEELIKESEKYLEEEEFIKENKGKDVFEVNHKKSVENRLLDLMFSVLTNEEHILETKTPLDTFTEKLRKMSGVVKDKKPLSMLQSSCPAYQLQVKNWYIGGGKGIGPFALNNVHHALTQITGYTIDGYDISGVIGKDGIAIVDWLSALINANVDIAKDPYIFHLNVNQGTYDIVNFLIRAGYGEQTFWFVNQPFMKEFLTDETAANKANKLARKDATKAQYELRLEEIKDITAKYSTPETALTDDSLKNYVTVSEEDRDYKFYAKQAGLYLAKETIDKSADKLSASVLNSRIDNKGFGNTLGDLRKFDKDFQSLREKDSSFDHLISSTFLNTMYNNSIPFIRELYSGLTLDSTNGFDEIIQTIVHNYSDDLDVSHISNAVYSSIISQYFKETSGFNLTKERVAGLFRGESSLGYRIQNLTTTYPELIDNKFIKTLKPVQDTTDNVWFLKYISGDKNDKFTRDSFSEGWGDLLEHSDPIVRKLGEDLIYYSFYTSGFNRSLYSFYQDIPISKLTERPGHSPKELTRSFDEFIKDMIKELSSFTLSQGFKDKIVEGAMKYLGSNDIAEYSGPKTAVGNGDKIGLFKLNPNSAKEIGKNSSGDPIYTNMYTIRGDKGTYTVEYIGYKTGTKEPVYRVIPSSGLEYKGHKIYELGYEGSIFEDNTMKVNPEDIATFPGFEDFILVGAEDKRISEEAVAAEKEDKPIMKDKQQVIAFGTPTTISFYTNDIKPSPNTIFVFGSNPEGRHGAGAAKVAKDKFGAIYGQGEGLQGNAYALPTKDLRVKENKGFKSISTENIVFSIQKLYEVAKQNPNKQFAIGYRNTTERSLNGYTGLEMIDMFTEAGVIPNNIVFSKEWFDTGKIQKDIKTEETKPELTNLQEARLAGLPENIRNDQRVINASLNMSQEEFKAIIEQIKKCN